MTSTTTTTTPAPPYQTAIIFLNLPPKTFIGIDLASFDSSPNFHAIINLPTGLHFLYTGTDATLSIRHGVWLKFDGVNNTTQRQQQHRVLRWNPEIESLDLLDPTSTAARTAVQGIPSFQGRGLVDYTALQEATFDLRARQSVSNDSEDSKPPTMETWTESLTRHITISTIERILGSSRSISSVSSSAMDMEKIPGLSAQESARFLYDHHGDGDGDSSSTTTTTSSLLGFVSIDLKRTWPEGSIGSDRSEKARDRSWYLGSLIDSVSPSLPVPASRGGTLKEKGKKKGDESGGGGGGGGGGKLDRKVGAREILAELQFCFVMVLTLANYSCLEQWKRILSICLTAKVAVTEVEPFFVEIVKVLRDQLERVEDVDGGLFDMGDEVGSAWLRALLKKFRRAINEVVSDGGHVKGLDDELKRLEHWLRDTYGWEDDRNLLRRGMVELEDGEMIEVQMDGLDEEEETGEYAPVVVEL